MEDWDQETLEAAIKQKHANENKPTEIICKFFLDAVELIKKKKRKKGRDESEWNKTQSLFQGSSSSSSRVDDDEASLSTGAVRV